MPSVASLQDGPNDPYLLVFTPLYNPSPFYCISRVYLYDQCRTTEVMIYDVLEQVIEDCNFHLGIFSHHSLWEKPCCEPPYADAHM